MAYEFLLPDIGEGLTEAVIVRWLVDVGQELALDAPMVEVETDKAVVEIPAPRAGVLLHQGVAAGEVIEVDELLAVIGEPGEKWFPGAPPAPKEEPDAAPAPIVGTLEEAAGPEALPAVRRLARELGVDLADVAGTGPGGRIVAADVEAAAAGAGGTVEAVPLSRMRRRIAEHMERSWREIPHVVTYDSADAGPLLERKKAADVPLEALLIQALVPVLQEFPAFNATLSGDRLLLRRHYDIGFAVDTEDGLVVAVVRGADGRDVPGLAGEVRRLAEAAKRRTAAPDDLTGATFTVSNIGAVGGGYGTPLIPLGTTAILSVGRADPVPVVAGDAVTVGRRFPLSLSYDHRVIDGALGRRFMAAVVDAFESP